MARNRLANETSPYLLQHADNPVDWYPWCEEALQRARDENKPILLSIGYSACHWCHVMAHESFEDEATAAVMNDLYINIKVDREERPDIDRIYQTAQHLLTQRNGGWPLTMFLTPDDHVPFFGGTYFPKQPQYNLPGFIDLLTHISNAYKENGTAIRDQNLSMLNALANIEPPTGDATVILNPAPIQTAITQYQNTFNSRSGGFGGAPKFPQPTNHEFLLHYATNQIDGLGARDEAIGMVVFTLEKMCRGGIFDHIGGGFARYSVDDDWMIPHFEKMLYDNGPLLQLCTHAWRITGNELFKQAATMTADWVRREMQSAEGGYYSSLDADSEGVEGKYYVWDKAEIEQLLDEQHYAVVECHYGLDKSANFEGEWHLHAQHTIAETAGALAIQESECAQLIESARSMLYTAREQRIRPGCDDKVLTSWNALMIQGMAMAGHVLQKPEYTDSAFSACDFIRANMFKQQRLLATYKDGKAHLNAYLDDYALLLQTCLTLLQVRWQPSTLDFARQLADALLQYFYDEQQQCFYFTSHDHEQLIQRNRPFIDETLPAGNGVAARALNQLGHLLGEPRYLEVAASTLRAGWSSMERIPYAHGSMLSALLDQLQPPVMIILSGQQEALTEWQQAIHTYSLQPDRMIFSIGDTPVNLNSDFIQSASDSGVTAQICVADRCLAPMHDLASLLDYLRNGNTE